MSSSPISAAPLIVGPSAPLGMPLNMATAAPPANGSAAASASGAPAGSPMTHRYNAATKLTAKNPAVMHILLIRHAESSNNVLAEKITQERGIHPYGPDAHADVMAEYEKRRTVDPDLSPLGYKQALLLPKHPHLLDIQLNRLAEEGRVRVTTSPMQRAILTSRPLLASVSGVRANLCADVCEKGGSYTSHVDSTTGRHVNKASAGHGRAELTKLWGDSHDCSSVREDGWWHTTCPGAEDDDAFKVRLGRAERWMQERIAEYTSDPHATPDYLLIVSHADFIDAIITKILKLENHAKYVFYSSNTAISHLEFNVTKGAPQCVRVRGTNIKPVKVDSHELAELAREHHDRPITPA